MTQVLSCHFLGEEGEKIRSQVADLQIQTHQFFNADYYSLSNFPAQRS